MNISSAIVRGLSSAGSASCTGPSLFSRVSITRGLNNPPEKKKNLFVRKIIIQITIILYFINFWKLNNFDQKFEF